MQNDVIKVAVDFSNFEEIKVIFSMFFKVLTTLDGMIVNLTDNCTNVKKMFFSAESFVFSYDLLCAYFVYSKT